MKMKMTLTLIAALGAFAFAANAQDAGGPPSGRWMRTTTA
jgi:hypothetical protein